MLNLHYRQSLPETFLSRAPTRVVELLRILIHSSHSSRAGEERSTLLMRTRISAGCGSSKTGRAPRLRFCFQPVSFINEVSKSSGVSSGCSASSSTQYACAVNCDFRFRQKRRLRVNMALSFCRSTRQWVINAVVAGWVVLAVFATHQVDEHRGVSPADVCRDRGSGVTQRSPVGYYLNLNLMISGQYLRS